MNYSNIDFSLVYVDPSAATGGDGATPATALNVLTTLNNNTCYLIRRTAESSFVTLPQTADVSDTLVNVAFMGMPKSTDRFWNFVPEAARTAWGGDSADYANLCGANGTSYSSSGYLALSSVRTLLLHRCFLYRTGSNTSNYLLDVTNTNANSAILLDHCKFGVLSVPLESSAFTGTLSGAALNFLHVKSARVFAMKNCILHCFSSSSSAMGGSSLGIYLEGANYIAIDEVDVYSPTYQMDSCGPALKMVATDAIANYASLRFHILPNGTYRYLPQLFDAENHAYCSMSSVSVDIPNRTIGSGTPTDRVLTCTLIQCKNLSEFSIQDVDIDLDKCWYATSGGHAFYLSGSSSSSDTVGGEHLVKNVTVNFAETGGLDTENNGYYYSQAKENSHQEYYAAVVLTFSIPSYGNGSGEIASAESIAVTHPRGVAVYAAGLQLKNSTFTGTVKLNGVQADITSLTSFYPGYALMVSGGSAVRVRTLSVDKTTATVTGGVSDPSVSHFDSSLVYIDSSNVELRSNVPDTDDDGNEYAVICGNEVSEGHFIQRTTNGFCDTYNVNRTGGASASFKLWNNACETDSDITLGHVPFLGIQLTPSATGKHNFVAYAAVKNQPDNTDLANRLLLQVSVPQDGGGYRVYFSNTDGKWEEDTTSVWNNESGLACYKLTIPLDVETTSAAVDVKVHYNWYSTSGFAFLDPKFVLTSIA